MIQYHSGNLLKIACDQINKLEKKLGLDFFRINNPKNIMEVKKIKAFAKASNTFEDF
jgi:hypothetical protein